MVCLHRGLERIWLAWRPDLRFARNIALNFGWLLADNMRFCDGEVADAYWKSRIIESKVVKLGNSAPRL